MAKRLTILLVLFLLAVVFACWFLLLREEPKKEQPSNLFSTTTPTTTTPTAITTPIVKPYQPLLVSTDDWKVYRNDRFAFILRYPSNWRVRDVVKEEKYEMIEFISDEQEITLMIEENPKGLAPKEFFTTDNSEPDFFLQSSEYYGEYYNGKVSRNDYFVFNVPGFVPLKVAIIDADFYFVELDTLNVQKEYKIFDSMLMSFKPLD